MLALLAMTTFVAVAPPEPDVDYMCLLRGLGEDADIVECFPIEDLRECMVFHASGPGVYTAWAWDWAGNVSLPSNPIRLNDCQSMDVNLDGSVDVLDSVVLRRWLAGLP